MRHGQRRWLILAALVATLQLDLPIGGVRAMAGRDDLIVEEPAAAMVIVPREDTKEDGVTALGRPGTDTTVHHGIPHTHASARIDAPLHNAHEADDSDTESFYSTVNSENERFTENPFSSATTDKHDAMLRHSLQLLLSGNLIAGGLIERELALPVPILHPAQRHAFAALMDDDSWHHTRAFQFLLIADRGVGFGGTHEEREEYRWMKQDAVQGFAGKLRGFIEAMGDSDASIDEAGVNDVEDDDDDAGVSDFNDGGEDATHDDDSDDSRTNDLSTDDDLTSTTTTADDAIPPQLTAIIAHISHTPHLGGFSLRVIGKFMQRALRIHDPARNPLMRWYWRSVLEPYARPLGRDFGYRWASVFMDAAHLSSFNYRPERIAQSLKHYIKSRTAPIVFTAVDMIMEDGDHTLSSIPRDTRLLRLARIADAFANAPMLRWQELKRAERDVQDGDSDVSDDVESNDGSYLDKGSGI